MMAPIWIGLLSSVKPAMDRTFCSGLPWKVMRLSSAMACTKTLAIMPLTGVKDLSCTPSSEAP